LAGKAIPLRVLSLPAGANFKVDGEDAGRTPKMVDFSIGVHTLEFSEEGYAPGSTPLEVTADAGVKLRTRIEEDPRIRSAEMKQALWFSFELSSDSDLHNALDWLSLAYESLTKK
jgi:hypothetical protein